MDGPLSPLVDERDLPPAALRAAVLDGELIELGEGFRPIDLPVDVEARADSLRSIAVRDRVLAGPTAAWVWGASSRLERPYTLLVPSTAAVAHHAGLEAELKVSTVSLRPVDRTRIAGVALTVPLRTAIDLLCRSWRPGDEEIARALLDRAGLLPDDLLAELMLRRRMPGRTLAIARAQVLVTR